MSVYLKKYPDPEGFTGKSYRTSNEKLTSMFSINNFINRKERNSHFMKPVLP